MLWYGRKTGVAKTSHMKKNGRYYGQIRCYCNRSTRCGSNRLTPLFTTPNPGQSRTGYGPSVCSVNAGTRHKPNISVLNRYYGQENGPLYRAGDIVEGASPFRVTVRYLRQRAGLDMGGTNRCSSSIRLCRPLSVTRSSLSNCRVRG